MNTVTFLRKAGAVTFLDLNSEINDEHSVDPPSDDGYAVQDELLDSEITEDEVRKVIRTPKSEKAAGADQIIVEFLKSAKRIILSFLVILCCVILIGAFSQRSGPNLLSCRCTRKETVMSQIIIEEFLC